MCSTTYDMDFKKHTCDIGACTRFNERTKLFSFCNKCAFKSCMECLVNLLRIRQGCIYPTRKFTCPCCNSLASDTFLHEFAYVSVSYIMNITKLIITSQNTPNKIGYCKNAECKNPIVGINIKHKCSASTDDSHNNDYFFCDTCVIAREKKIIDRVSSLSLTSMSSNNNNKEDLRDIFRSFPPGTIFRTCPGCMYYITRISDPEEKCAHMSCPNCKIFFCWICRESFESSGECYTHMDDEEDYAKENGLHYDVYDITANTLLLPHADDYIVK